MPTESQFNHEPPALEVITLLKKLPGLEQSSAKPGSKQAVLRHFGIFKEDADLDVQLAGLRARREAAE